MTAARDGEGASAAQAVGPMAAQRPTRVLLGWMADSEAIPQMLGRAAAPHDDLAGPTSKLVAAQAAVSARPAFSAGDPVLRGDTAVLRQIAERPDLQMCFANVSWKTEWVDLAKVQSVQKFVHTDDLDSRVAAAATNVAGLVELCLPQPKPEQIQISQDQDGLGFTASSLNPHLHPIGLPPQEVMVASAPGNLPQALLGKTFAIGVAASFLHVARYHGRYILRDGTHRAAGLLRAGVTVLPTVVVDAPSWEYVAPLPGLLEREVVMGDHPPLLVDYWDETVSAEGMQPRLRTYVRFRAEKFVLPE
jgi:hypothetical protein